MGPGQPVRDKIPQVVPNGLSGHWEPADPEIKSRKTGVTATCKTGVGRHKMASPGFVTAPKGGGPESLQIQKKLKNIYQTPREKSIYKLVIFVEEHRFSRGLKRCRQIKNTQYLQRLY